MSENEINRGRNFLKDEIRQEVDFSRTDQSQGHPPPPIQKPVMPGQEIINLPGKADWKSIKSTDLITAIDRRKSHRRYNQEKLSIEELSFLLWAIQGIRFQSSPARAYRTVPSAGCRHAFETYISISQVQGLGSGIYRYLPAEHGLVFEHEVDRLKQRLVSATSGQKFIGRAAAVFFWTTIPYRMEWRYDAAAHKVIAIDAGHLCQNLYLACEAIGCGTCAVAAYEQNEIDQLLQVNGRDEFTIYLAPVGKI